jgi:cholesterol oxidase
MHPEHPVYDYVIVGSGFGGSVSAMRLTEKGYSVLVIERGKRFQDQDFATTNWKFWKYLWAPPLRSFGILQISPFKDVFVLHGAGVGGGSLGYATVLMQPDEDSLSEPGWQQPIDWKNALAPYYQTARSMLGVTPNPRLWKADGLLRDIAAELGQAETFHPTDVGIFFTKHAKEGQEVPDPFFQGEGPVRNGCIHCGGCMVGCRYNAKNTLVKNYLYLAEKWGAEILSEAEVRDIRTLAGDQADGARYELAYRSSTAWLVKPEKTIRARNVILSAGALGTLRLLFRCRDITGSMPALSPRLGDQVRTNSEAILGATTRSDSTDFSKGIAITSIFHADRTTTIEPVRYPAGSDLMRLLAGPLLSSGSIAQRLLKSLAHILRHPIDFFRVTIKPGWAKSSTILLVMQTEDNRVKMRLGRHLTTLFRRGLVSETDQEKPIPTQIQVGHQVTREFAAKTDGIALGSFTENLFNVPITAHILGGCPVGLSAEEGVVDLNFEVFNYPGVHIIDGSVVPANPGVNPSLTITALAEYAAHKFPPKPGAPIRKPIGVPVSKDAHSITAGTHT